MKTAATLFTLKEKDSPFKNVSSEYKFGILSIVVAEICIIEF